MIIDGACKLMLGINEINAISPVTKKSMDDSLWPRMSCLTYNCTEVPGVNSLSKLGVMHRSLELLMTVAKILRDSPKVHVMLESKKCDPVTSTTVLPFKVPADGFALKMMGSVTNM
jgi:hypothetical protein